MCSNQDILRRTFQRESSYIRRSSTFDLRGFSSLITSQVEHLRPASSSIVLTPFCQVFYAHLSMATLSPRNLPSMFHEKDNDDMTLANAIAYYCLTMFLQDCKDVVASFVRTSINTQLRSQDKSHQRHGKARKDALKAWCKSDKPLSWGPDSASTSDTYRQILIILHENSEGQRPSLKTSADT